MTDPTPKPRTICDRLIPYIPGESQQGLIKLSSNENPLGCPVSAEELAKSISSASVYPSVQSHPLTTQLCDKHGCGQDELILGNGSDDVLMLCALAYLNPGDEVISSAHTFSVYCSIATLMDATYIEVDQNNWYYDLTAMADAVTEKTKLIFIANPNNPTGTCLSVDTLRSFCKKIPSSVCIVIDEAYRDFVDFEPVNSTESLWREFPNVLMTRTFSKLYGLAGFRVGYGLAQASVCAALSRVKAPFNCNSVGLTAASIALDSKQDFISRSLAVTAESKVALQRACQDWPVTLLPSQANFVCLLLTKHSAQQGYDALIDAGFICRKLSSFGLDNGIRITLGDASTTQAVIAALDTFFREN